MSKAKARFWTIMPPSGTAGETEAARVLDSIRCECLKAVVTPVHLPILDDPPFGTILKSGRVTVATHIISAPTASRYDVSRVSKISASVCGLSALESGAIPGGARIMLSS